MAYRDEGEALIEQLAAVKRELATSRREVDALKRTLRGDAEPREVPVTGTDEILAELESARSLLAGLIGDDTADTGKAGKAGGDPGTAGQGATGQAVKKHTSKPGKPDRALEVLRLALRTILVRKLGSIDNRVRADIDRIADALELVELIADVALAEDPQAIDDVMTNALPELSGR